jgi:hypothetical protein
MSPTSKLMFRPQYWEKEPNGTYQRLHIYNFRIIYHLYTGIGLSLDPINLKPALKEINHGTLYFTGNVRGIFTILVIRQPCCEVAD